MTIKRIKDFPEGSESLSNDDIVLIMDDPSNTSITKKISISQLATAITTSGISLSSELIQDTSPQLGGNLDLNASNIIGTGNLVINGSGNFMQGIFVSGASVVKSDTSQIVNSSGIYNMVQLTQAAYDALGSYDNNTLYFIV
jgi:hypothetical protein